LQGVSNCNAKSEVALNLIYYHWHELSTRFINLGLRDSDTSTDRRNASDSLQKSRILSVRTSRWPTQRTAQTSSKETARIEEFGTAIS